jgi:N4-gp56 family major capsid protein
MVMQNYSTVPSRNLIRAERQMLKHAEPIIVLGKFGQQKEQPQKATDTVVFRRMKPFNATAAEVPNITAANFVLSEGTTPGANTISYTDVTATLQNYGVLFKFSSKTQLMYEDDIPADMQKQTSETLAEVLELVRYGQYKAGTGVSYANGSSRSAVNSKVSLGKLRSIARTIQSNRGKKVTQILAPSPNYGTKGIEGGYVVFHHSDVNADIRDLPGFVPVADYGSRKTISPDELGSCEEFRFIASPLFAPYADAGGTASTNSTKSTTGTNSDVYPMLVMAEDAWGSVALKGMGAIKPTMLPATQINHANPMGMFGYVGANTWFTSVRLNENWMQRLEVAVSDL